jgi:hypothetical protein
LVCDEWQARQLSRKIGKTSERNDGGAAIAADAPKATAAIQKNRISG